MAFTRLDQGVAIFPLAPLAFHLAVFTHIRVRRQFRFPETCRASMPRAGGGAMRALHHVLAPLEKRDIAVAAIPATRMRRVLYVGLDELQMFLSQCGLHDVKHILLFIQLDAARDDL